MANAFQGRRLHRSNRSAYLLAFIEPVAGGSVVKGFGVFSEERPTIAISEKAISERGAWATIHVEHGSDYEDALVAMREFARQHYPWILALLPEQAKASLASVKPRSERGQITP